MEKQKDILKKATDEELAVIFTSALQMKVNKSNILNEIKSRKPSDILIRAVLNDLTL